MTLPSASLLAIACTMLACSQTGNSEDPADVYFGSCQGACETLEQIALGDVHTCGLRPGGTVACWGHNHYGQLGAASSEPCGGGSCSSKPLAVQGLSGVTKIGLGAFHSCARKSDGTVACWGYNSTGALGDGTTTDRTSPQVVPGLAGVADLAVGDNRTCALTTDGRAFWWGYNRDGGLGDGTTLSKTVPTEIPGLAGVTQIALGGSHACALRSDGTVLCWGEATWGQLGSTGTAVCDGETASGVPVTCNTVPQAVPRLSNVSQIALGVSHSCALTTDGTVMCWGRNDDGQLGGPSKESCPNVYGDGSRPCSMVPLVVPGVGDIVAIALGSSHSCARRADGAVLCWGNNSNGQLGDGTTVSRAAPAAVLRTSSALASLGDFHSCALLEDGRPVCWGDNHYGQLGDGTMTDSVRPVLVAW